jgi:hypothetical protein
MVQRWTSQAIVIASDVVRHPWVMGIDTVSRVCEGVMQRCVQRFPNAPLALATPDAFNFPGCGSDLLAPLVSAMLATKARRDTRLSSVVSDECDSPIFVANC